MKGAPRFAVGLGSAGAGLRSGLVAAWFRLGFGLILARFGFDLASGLHLRGFCLDLVLIWLDLGLDFALSHAFPRICFHYSRLS